MQVHILKYQYILISKKQLALELEDIVNIQN